MCSWSKDNTAFVMIKGGYKYHGFTAEGYQAVMPYIGNAFFLRLFRELCFRLPFLPKKIWFNKEILKDKERLRHIVVFDALIIVEYLAWLQKNIPDARIYFKYENMVGRARHLLPGQIPAGIRVWTYDEYDSEKFKINLYQNYIYFQSYVRPKQELEYDVFFIGRDKGRGEYLLGLEKEMQHMGLRTKFIITADGRFAKKKPYYQSELSYAEIVEYLTKSRAVLNVVMKNQHGVTLRDAESVFFNLKLITTNSHISKADFYSSDRVFVLGERKMEELRNFVLKDLSPVDASLLRKHCIAGMVDEITSG